MGPVFQVRFPEDLLAGVDRAAAGEGLTRAAWLRVAAQDRVWITREELSGFVCWLLEEQMVEPSEVGRVIEKPWCYQDWLRCYRAGEDLTDDPDQVRRHEPSPGSRTGSKA